MTDSDDWRAIPGFGGYQANLGTGEIRSIDRTIPDGRRLAGGAITQHKSNRGYMLVPVVDDNGKAGKRTVHKLVFLAKYGRLPGPGMVVRHLNDNPEDNRAVNLAEGTPADNEGDKFRLGTRQRVPPRLCIRCGSVVDKGGRRCHACVVEIGEQAAPLLASGVPLEEVGKRLDYPHLSGLLVLAQKYGGLRLVITPPTEDFVAQFADPALRSIDSPSVITTLRNWWRGRRGDAA